MKIVTVIGARPQYIKAAPVSKALAIRHHEILVDTGQHYDEQMSAVFFRELGIPDPSYNLKIGSGRHGAQTGAMLRGVEDVLIQEQPDFVVVYGDTNSTLAGALAAAKLNIPVAHIEAGLRSFNRGMPEELNRVLTDHASTLLFAPSARAVENLRREGITAGVFVVGDIMLDATNDALASIAAKRRASGPTPGASNPYAILTIHRADTTDSGDRLAQLLRSVGSISMECVFPVHPRTRAAIATHGIQIPANIRCVDPLSYHAMIELMAGAEVTLTDSGGLQKESYYVGVPCVTLRSETEWTETVEAGWNILCHPETGDIASALERALSARSLPRPNLYGDGRSASTIVDVLSNTPTRMKAPQA